MSFNNLYNKLSVSADRLFWQKIILLLPMIILLFKSTHTCAITFATFNETYCSEQLEKAINFIKQLEYKLALTSHGHTVAWTRQPDGKWLKLTTGQQINLTYPINIIDISNHRIIFEIFITPLCKRLHTLEQFEE